MTYYLPDPTEVKNEAIDLEHGEERFPIEVDPQARLIALAFKLEEGRFGQLTYVRLYQGTLRQRRHDLQQSHRPRDAGRPPGAHARRRDGGDRGRLRRRHRRAVRRRLRVGRHVHERPLARLAQLDPRARAGGAPVDPAEGPRPRGQAGQGAGAVHQGRSDVPHPRRRGVGPDDRVGDGRAAPRRVRRAHAARVRGRGRDRRATGRVPRGDQPACDVRLHAQEADRWLGAVRANRRATSSRSSRASSSS